MKEIELWSIERLRLNFKGQSEVFGHKRQSRSALWDFISQRDFNGRAIVSKKRCDFIASLFVFAVFVLALHGIFPISIFAKSDFRVEGAGVEASPTSYVGACPGVIKFNAKIQANGAGRVKYTWLRNDGAAAPVESIDFTEAGVKYVSTTWTLGDARVLPAYSGWQQIKILAPNEYFSNKAEFKLSCQQAPAEQCTGENRAVSWAQRVLGGDGNSIYALAVPDTQTITLGSMHVGEFGAGRIYPDLAALLGVSEADLAKADVIAFELNGGGPAKSGGFESSHWTFSDGVNPPQTIDFDETRDWRTISGVVANGTISFGSREDSGRKYSRFFGISPEFKEYVSYILFDLQPEIRASNPAFNVKVSSFAGAGEGSPDVDAVGVLNCSPKTAVLKK